MEAIISKKGIRWVLAPNDMYNISHIKGNYSVFVINGSRQTWIELTPEEIHKYYNKIGEANLYGFKAGDKIPISCVERMTNVRTPTNELFLYEIMVVGKESPLSIGLLGAENRLDQAFATYLPLEDLAKRCGK
jgi:hypothetical protein